jgi:hypothetical protein
MYRQRPVKGGRTPLPACVLKAIDREVVRLANKYDCSKSWVIATILAEATGVSQQDKYYEIERSIRRLKRVK